MVADKTTARPQHSSCVDVDDERELRYWSEKFGVTREELVSAVRKVGPLLSELEMHFTGPGAGESRSGRKSKQ